MKAVVIGAGVTGLSCAYGLALRGVDVTVLDSGRVGAAASAGNAGWVTPFLSAPRAAPGAVGHAVRGSLHAGGPVRLRLHFEAAFLSWMIAFVRATRSRVYERRLSALQQLARLAPSAFDEIAERGVAFERHQAGLAIVARSRRGYEECRRLAASMVDVGYRGAIRCLRGTEVTDFEPAVRRDMFGIVHVLDDGHVRPETVTRGLATALRSGGAAVHEHFAVSRVVHRDGRWSVQASDGRDHLANSVLMAAGVGTRSLLGHMGVQIPLEAARGTSLTAAGDGMAPRHPLKLSEDMIACTPFGSSVRISGGFDVGFRGGVPDRRRLEAIVRRGLRYLEDWRPTRVESRWVGHRPMAPDDLPIIGEIPGRSGLYLATGHGTLGITLGPITGRLVSLEMTRQEQRLLAPFRPGRFHRWTTN